MITLAERNRQRATHGHKRGGVASPEYNVWCGMRARCQNPKNDRYQEYGGRGITICEAWNSFETFLADMGQRPSLQHTLERVDNDGNYEPSNCRWATRAEQARNRRTNKIITFRGRSMTMAEAIELSGLKRETVWYRVYSGWQIEKALTLPAGANSTKSGREMTP